MIAEILDNSEEPSKDERYTVEYIEREAFLLLRSFTRRKKQGFQQLILNHQTARDDRILRRWGLK